MVQAANKRFVMESDLDDFRTGAYRYLDTLYYTSSGTFTKATYPDLRGIRVTCLGGGGGGAGAAITAATTTSIGTGGNGGHYSESFITDITGLESSVTVTVGNGGLGASGAVDGNAGGSSSFGAYVIAGGGTGGNARAATAPPYITGPNTNAFTGTGELTIRGGVSSSSFAISTGFGNATGGGSSIFGFGQPDQIITTGTFDGTDELEHGVGGGGAANGISQASARLGGDAGPGVVIVELYI